MTGILDLYATLTVNEDTPAEDMLMARGRIDAAMAQLRELRQKLDEEFVIPAVKARGSVTIGTQKWWVAPDKETKCLDLAVTLSALFVACEGDFARVADCLSVNAMKHGACKKVLPADYGRLFLTTEKATLKNGTAAPLKLQAVDTRWLEVAK